MKANHNHDKYKLLGTYDTNIDKRDQEIAITVAIRRLCLSSKL